MPMDDEVTSKQLMQIQFGYTMISFHLFLHVAPNKLQSILKTKVLISFIQVWFRIRRVTTWLAKEKQSAFLENISIQFDYYYSPSILYLCPIRIRKSPVFSSIFVTSFNLLLTKGSHLFSKCTFVFYHWRNEFRTGQSDHSIVMQIQPIRVQRGKIVSFDWILFHFTSGVLGVWMGEFEIWAEKTEQKDLLEEKSRFNKYFLLGGNI